MKGLILAGGSGTRLRPFTHTGPKQLIPIANKPNILYCLEDLRDAGIVDIGVILGDNQPEKVRELLRDGRDFGVRITYVVQGPPRGIAHAIGCAESFLRGDAFCVYLGDNLLKGGIAAIVREFKGSRAEAGIALCRVPNPEMFGVAELNAAGHVVGLVEKPKEPKSDLALVGVYLFSEHIFESVKRIKPSFRDELEITDAIQDLIDRHLEVRPHIVDGWWKDTGKLEDMLEANRLILDTLEPRIEGEVDAESRIEGKVVIEAGAVVERSVIRGPVIIGVRARIVHAYVGPFTSIMNDVEIRNSEIEHSIVLEGSSVCDLTSRVVDSLMGRNVRIHRVPIKPSAYRFMVGDNSEVGIPW